MSLKQSEMRRFQLRRDEDESGVSGTGLVAEGVEFSTGKCALSWLTEFSCVSVYENIKALEHIHGHGGKTVVVWLDSEHVGSDFESFLKEEGLDKEVEEKTKTKVKPKRK